MSYFLGFDVAKAKLDWSLIDQQGIEQSYGNVSNETATIAALLLTVLGNYPGESITCVVEATSCYHHPLLDATTALDMPCIVYNPLITKQQTRATVRGKKTDRTDAFLVARVGWSGGGRLYAPEPYRSTKHYARSCQKLSGFRTSFNLYNSHFTNLLEGELDSQTIALMQGVEDAITAARKQLYKDLATSAKGETFRLLQTIPGVGPFIAASIIGEIQDMHYFKTVKAVTAFAGLDPKIRQSGHALNSTGKLTKRGSSYLRRSLFIGAGVARQFDTQFRALYDKKRNEGKSHKVATCVVARKLLTVARTVWLSGEDYVVPERCLT